MGRVGPDLTDWWRRRRLTKPRIDQMEAYSEIHEIPESLGRHTLAVSGPDEAPKWAAFECPCGRGHRIVVSLQSTHRPHWRLSWVDARPSLWPSVDSHGADFRCHFWLEGGRVTWAKDRPRQAGPASETR